MYNKLPADPTAMILGIIALVVSFAGCCCGIFAFIPLILSIIGLVIANKSLREFQANPSIYEPQSKSNVSTSRILNIIALVMSSITILFYLAYFLIYGALFSTAIMEGYELQKNADDYSNEWENDSIYEYEDDYYEIEEDTIKVDSINIEELIETEIDSINN
ncbi:CCC motif membrane protein [Psychroserpens sp. Hel_I_66]|uniref:CCC motif membrane protein n=1 Tax=Psychroserpens sp. Hel_I_66 TaxID=1250004 RepID=UPI000A88AE6C|nr:CCC motif membrane protein [Psychroserpens sp. Hel_I_66]